MLDCAAGAAADPAESLAVVPLRLKTVAEYAAEVAHA
jgi:hypothetical protein